MIGAAAGIAIGLWWGLGAVIAGQRPATLPLKVDGCVVENNTWITMLENETTPKSISDTLNEITSIVPTFPSSDYSKLQPSSEDR